MATKQFNARQIQKHDTEANWDLTSGFIPFDGEIIIYDKDNTHDKPRMKVGDGVTDVKLLPFASGAVESVNNKTGVVTLTASDVGADPSGSASTVQDNLNTHTGNTTIHTNSTEKAAWNAKYNKPSGGIPKTDLASDVQTSLGKADTALQSAPVTSVNTKTGAVTLNASDVGAIPSSEKGVASGVATLDSSGKVPSSQLSVNNIIPNVPFDEGHQVLKGYNGSGSGDFGSVGWSSIFSSSDIDETSTIGSALITVIDLGISSALSHPESLIRAAFPLSNDETVVDQLIGTVMYDVIMDNPAVLKFYHDNNGSREFKYAALYSTFGYDVANSIGTFFGTLNVIINNYSIEVCPNLILDYNLRTLSLNITAIAHETKVIADPTSPTATPLVMPMVPAPVSGTLTLSSFSWTDNLDGTYSQSITITGSTNYSKIDLQPNAAVLSQLSADGVGAIYVTNQNNVLSAVAVGNAPTADLSVQYVMSAVYDGAVTPGGGSTPQVVSITMPASWTDNSDGTYSQVITSLITTAGATLTSASKVDVQVSASVVSQLTTDGVTGLYAQQNNGAVTMIMMGAEPSSTITVQLTISETNVI